MRSARQPRVLLHLLMWKAVITAYQSPLRPRIRRWNDCYVYSKFQPDDDASTTFPDQPFAVDLENSKQEQNIPMGKTTNGMKIIRFVGSAELRSSPVEMPTDPRTIHEFFALENSRDQLFSELAEICKLKHPTEDYMRRWKSEREIMLPAPSSEGTQQEVIQLETFVGFPGLRVCSEAVVGSELCMPSTSEVTFSDRSPVMFPEYRFILLDSRLKATGAPPLAWLFRRLLSTKQGSQNPPGTRPTTTSFTSVTAEVINGTDGNQLVFTTTARLEFQMMVPRSILRVIPGTVEDLENQGNNALQSFLENDLGTALVRFRDTYQQWSTMGTR